MEINEKEKLNIMLELLKERYCASHKMRERSTIFTVWVLGIGAASIGSLLIGFQLSCQQKWIAFFSTFLVAAFCFHFIHSIRNGFNNNRRIIIRLEKALGCYSPGFYVENESLYPDEYANISESKHYHFVTLYFLLSIVWLAIIILIFSSPSCFTRANKAIVCMQGPIDVKVLK